MTACTPELIEALCRTLRIGAYRQDACKAVGISTSTLANWIERGGKERRRIDGGARPSKRDSVFLEALQSIEKAEAEAQLSDLAIITRAAKDGAWQASAWKLERRNPDQWGRQRLDVQAGGQLVVEGAGWLARKIAAATGASIEDGAEGGEDPETDGDG